MQSRSWLLPCFCLLVAFLATITSFNSPSPSRQYGRLGTKWLSNTRVSTRVLANSVQEAVQVNAEAIPSPGSPVIRKHDLTEKKALVSIAINGVSTQAAYQEACKLLNEDVKKKKNIKMTGFRSGATMPASYLIEIYGKEQVNELALAVLEDKFQEEFEKCGLAIVGKPRVLSTATSKENFQAGKDAVFDIECDLWPTISYTGEHGYKGLAITVAKTPQDEERLEKVKLSIRERYKLLQATETSYEAKVGDVIRGNMKGYAKQPNGKKGSLLPVTADGDNINILLEKGKLMPEVVDGMVGSKAGETRSIEVTFPQKLQGPGAPLSGKEAIFEVEVLEVMTATLPAWDEELANRIREGMTLQELDSEVQQAVNSDAESQLETKRNEAITHALYDIASIDKIPDTLIEDITQERFQNTIEDFRRQGSTDEHLAQISTASNYAKYKEISKANVAKVASLGLIFNDIAEREEVKVTEEEIQAQIDVLQAQNRQQNQPLDIPQARTEIQNVLLRKKVFDLLASTATITYTEPVTAPPTSTEVK